MQPNLQQDDKFNYSAKQRVMISILICRTALPVRSNRRARRDASDLARVGVSVSADARARAMAQIAALLPQGTVLITGAVRAPELAPGQKLERAYNSIYVIDHDGTILSSTTRFILCRLANIYRPELPRTPRPHAAHQAARRLHPASGGAPWKCRVRRGCCRLSANEIVFPGEARSSGERPGWLLNLTN